MSHLYREEMRLGLGSHLNVAILLADLPFILLLNRADPSLGLVQLILTKRTNDQVVGWD